ncbi:hypothetical protein ABZW11_03340 [Nonomuraea sp. NPDC004580]
MTAIAVAPLVDPPAEAALFIVSGIVIALVMVTGGSIWAHREVH